MFLRCLPGRPSKQLSLISVLLQCEVKGGIASVKATQTFRNEDPDPLECIYKFPVQDEASIVSLTITTEDGRVLEAKVEDQEEAKEKYSDNISTGNTAVMGIVKEDKEFELNIGNLAPSTGITTAISFVLPLKCTANRWLFKVPGWLQPTWESSVPVRPVPFPQFVPNQKYQFGFSMTIQEFSPIIEVTSPSHQVTVDYDDLRLKASVALNERHPASQSSKEILIEFKTSEDFSPKVQVQLDESTGEYVGMLSFLPPLLEEDEAIDDLEGYGDHVLVLDRSYSMEGKSIEMAKEAAILFLRSLPTTCKFNIVSFGSRFEKMYPESQLIESSSVTQAVSSITNFKADMGGTKIFAPLQAICSERSDPAYPRSIYLLTDGEVEDRQSTINFVEQNSKQTRVHAFGIGGSVDRALIIDCAKATNGAFAFIAEASEIKEKVISVLKRGMVPALSNIQIHWPSDTYVQYPSNQLLPVCYFGEAFHAFVHFGKAAVQAGNVLLTGTNTANKRSLSWEVPIGTNCGVGNFIEKLWAKYAIKEMSLDYRQKQNRDTLQKVKSLSKQYGVPCEHTAFICVQTNVQPVEGKLQMTSISMGVSQARQRPIGGVSAFGGSPRYRSGTIRKCMAKARAMSPPRMQSPQMCCFMPNMVDAPGDMMNPGFVPPDIPNPIMFGASAGGHAYPRPTMRTPPQGDSPWTMKPDPVPVSDTNPMMYPQTDFVQACYPMMSPAFQMDESPGEGCSMSSLPSTNYFQPVSSLPHLHFTKASLLDLISRQEVDGKWLFESIPDVIGTCPLPADFNLQEDDALDLWVTLCIVVLIKKKFAAQEKEWELVVKKAVKLLKRTGVNIDQYSTQIEAQLGF